MFCHINQFQLPVADGKNADENADLVEHDMLAGGEFIPWSDDDDDCEDDYDQQQWYYISWLQ